MRYLTLVLLIFYFTSCAKDDNKSDSSTSATVLEGTWVTACEVNSSDNSSYNITDVFSGNNVVTTWNYFSDNSCTASTKYESNAFNNSPFDKRGFSIETSSRFVLIPVPKRISIKINTQKI